ncbi:TolC family outer membrane protein [Puniceibacterium sediminis]|uniref:Outer membrane protein n=1 Tax=Puniceibacterium sediminis TaxID=1608407 RepID=A0A238UW87_9RHOB|nr:TolC family outer membrane protein [Puniceibacterium sediminis]SNR25603.1 outer membrane protein [Puniceibacterium sediminis]
MMTPRALLKHVTTGLAVVWIAAAAQADTLADALVGAYNTSGLLEQNRAVLRSADESVAQSISGLRPVLNWVADLSRDFGTVRSATTGFQTVANVQNTTSIGLSAEITLFDFGQTGLAIDAAKESVLATRQSLLSVEQQILLRAVQAFFEVRRATETVSLRQNNLRLITQELRAAEDRFEVGEVTRTDVALAQARLAASRSALSAAQGNLVIAQEEYRVATGRRPGALSYPRTVPQLPPSVEAARAVAMRTHPDLLSAQYVVSVNELNILRAKAAMKPKLSVQGTIGITENVDNDAFTRGGSVSLNASGPIYQGGRLSSLVRQSMANRDSSRAQLQLTQLGIEQNVANAYVRVQVARSSRSASADQVRAAQIAFDGVREEATLGARTTLDVLDAEQELLDARASQISASVDEYVAAYAVLFSMGVLTADQLGLKVQQYDPSAYYNLVEGAPSKISKQGRELDRVLRALGKE